MENKISYFQGGGGVNEPTPKKTKYNPEKSQSIKVRFKDPFYKNYDLYDIPGKHGPGTGYHELMQYDSIKDFLDKKRKKLKNKYKEKIKARYNLFSKLIKIAVDFPLDDQINNSILNEDNSSQTMLSGILNVDEIQPKNDFTVKSPKEDTKKTNTSDFLGLPDGIDPDEDLDADKTIGIGTKNDIDFFDESSKYMDPNYNNNII